MRRSDAIGGENLAEASRSFDALLTSYLIDVLPDVSAAVRSAAGALRVGGVWVNVGPLQARDARGGGPGLALALALTLALTLEHQTRPSPRPSPLTPALDPRPDPGLRSGTTARAACCG